MNCSGSIYILTNKHNTVLYIGVTTNLVLRIIKHRSKKWVDAFTARYNCDKLVYYEYFDDIVDAMAREKQLKKWRRKWKEELINKINPLWRDLFDDVERDYPHTEFGDL